MIEGNKILAIIPARAGSKGLPGKNKRLLNGKPLLQYPIETALASTYIDECYLSTDDHEMMDIGIKSGASCPELRPAELASDRATSASVIQHVVDQYQNDGQTFDYIVLLEPTSPLTQAEDVDTALLTLHQNRKNADSIVGIALVDVQHPVYLSKLGNYGLLEPYHEDFGKLRRQDIDELYHLDGSFYISDQKVFESKKSFYHSRTMGYVMSKWKSYEIDDIADFYAIEGIMRNLEEIK